MTLSRFWCLLAAGSVLLAGSGTATAQTAAYPTKPIRFLVGVAPGGGTDFVARLIGFKLTERFGQPVITDNRTGATGTIALEMVAKAPPDGYTFAVFNIGHLTAALLARIQRIDPARDFAPVGQIATGTLMLGLHAGVPAKTLDQFIAYARSKPGPAQLRIGRPGQHPATRDGIAQARDAYRPRARAVQGHRADRGRSRRGARYRRRFPICSACTRT